MKMNRNAIQSHNLCLRRSPSEPYILLAADIIKNAIDIATRRIVANDYERTMAIAFLRDSKCRRWCQLLGLEGSAVSSSIETILSSKE